MRKFIALLLLCVLFGCETQKDIKKFLLGKEWISHGYNLIINDEGKITHSVKTYSLEKKQVVFIFKANGTFTLKSFNDNILGKYEITQSEDIILNIEMVSEKQSYILNIVDENEFNIITSDFALKEMFEKSIYKTSDSENWNVDVTEELKSFD